MPVKLNDIVIMGDDGKFTPEFNPGMLGDEYKDSKYFGDETPDLTTLMKRAIDTKRAFGKKIEGHIAPLGENPTDDEKTAHRTQLMSGLGTAVKNAEEYELAKPADWPEGVPYDEETSKHFADYLFAQGWPKEMVQGLVTEYDKVALERFQAFAAEEHATWEISVKEYKNEHKGTALIKKTRTAAKAMIQFGTDELIKAIKEKQLITTPDNFENWAALNISTDQLRVWTNIGEAMKSDSAITDEGISTSESKNEQKSKLSSIYDHDTSKNMT